MKLRVFLSTGEPVKAPQAPLASACSAPMSVTFISGEALVPGMGMRGDNGGWCERMVREDGAWGRAGAWGERGWEVQRVRVGRAGRVRYLRGDGD